MNRNKLPTGVLQRLVELDEEVEFLNRKVDDLERGIASARTRLSGTFRTDQEYHDLRASLKQMVDDKPAVETKFHRTRALAAKCKRWLDELPDGTVLEPVKVRPTNGADLGDVRERIKDAENELHRLRSVPTPSADIKQRVAAYVQALAQPEVRGIGAGQDLVVKWPSSVIAVFALLFPEKLQAAILTEIDAMANDPLPIKQRRERITELEAEIERLHYTEEALVVANGADRSPGALPQCVLGVRAVEARRVTRAA
jgi:hypothetical protein